MNTKFKVALAFGVSLEVSVIATRGGYAVSASAEVPESLKGFDSKPSKAWYYAGNGIYRTPLTEKSNEGDAAVLIMELRADMIHALTTWTALRDSRENGLATIERVIIDACK